MSTLQGMDFRQPLADAFFGGHALTYSAEQDAAVNP